MVRGLEAINSSNHALQHDEDIDWRYYQRYSFRDKEDDATHYSANAHPMIKNFMAGRLFKAMTAMIPHNTMAMKTDNKNTMPENLP